MQYEVGLGDTPMRISRKLNGNPYRYGELLAANAHKPIVHRNGVPTFESLRTGEKLNVSSGFVGDSVGVGSIFGDIIRVVTAPITAPIKAIAKVTAKIPVIGSLTHIVDEAASAPANIAVSIASGERIDHVALDALKAQVKIVKDVAPYAATVVSLVPGVGTGVAAAISAGAALVEGQNITSALKAGIAGALPGGPIAAAAFNTAVKAASGENVGKAALESSRELIPAGPARTAFDIGVAVATGEKIQTALTKGLLTLAPGQLQSVLSAGADAIAKTPGLADALKTVEAGPAAEGFHLAAGLLSHSGINEKSLSAVRSQLPPNVVQGFDQALKTQTAHLPWLTNVVNAPIPTATGPAPTHAAVLNPPPAIHRAPPMMTEPVKKVAAPAPAPAKKPPMMTEPVKKPAVVAVKPATPAPVPPTPGAYAPYPKIGTSGTLSAAPTWGPRITQMSSAMQWAGRSAVHGTRGRPRMVGAPDGTTYLFAIENGVLTARPQVG